MFGEPCDQAFIESLTDPLIEYLNGRNKRFERLDLRDRHLRWIRLTGATLVDCDFSGATLDCVFADFSVFQNCRFQNCLVYESVFAGSRFVNCTFVGATADMCNFNAIAANNTDFSDASLRGSRFINARLSTVQFVNCDIKDALFQFSERNEVLFKHSNYEEACF